MKLKTEFKIQPSNFDIVYQDNLMFLGSCFSENVSSVLKNRKFNVLTNPFGIVYNPISLFRNIDFVLENKIFTEKQLFKNNEIWSSYDFHSDMSALESKPLLKNLNATIKTTATYLNSTTYLFITLGSSWVYEIDDKIVANCHKVTSNKFRKRLLTVNEIVDKATNTIQKILQKNNAIKIIISISPVRHLKDGFIENNQSKSILILAVKELVQKFKNIDYFPAYEYILDDLRDYRFYKKDLLHPNSLAIEYITEKFDKTYFNIKTINTIQKVEKINTALSHNVKFKKTSSYKLFKENTLMKIKKLEEEGLFYSETEKSF